MASDDRRRQHLWIPQEEVVKLKKEAVGRTTDRGVNFSEHGAILSHGLQTIVTAYSHIEDDSLSDEDIMVFKLVLPEGEDIYNKRNIAEIEGFSINAIKDKTHAVVTAKKSMFRRLQDRVGKYSGSGSLKHFQFVEEFEPLTTEDKQANSLRKYLAENKDVISIDVQMMLLPNLPTDVQNKAVGKLTEKIQKNEGVLPVQPYHLSDGTTIMRAMLPIKNLEGISEDPAIYRVEQTSFFQVSPSGIEVFGADLSLDPNIDINSLATVAVLDSDVDFPDDFAALVPVKWRATGIIGRSSGHGTGVASKVVFSHIGLQLTNSHLTPRAKIIACDIYGGDGEVSSDEMAQRIEEAVTEFADVCNLFNLSTNVPRPIDGDELSIMGYQLDCLMKKHGIKFVISAGNHYLALTSSSLEKILDDDDIRIAEPGDAMLGITVGAVAGVSHVESFSAENEIAAYSRTGPGFAGFYKPDLVSYGANLKFDQTIPRDPYSILLAPGGQLTVSSGTSFTAPVVAGDIAELLQVIPSNNILLAQALLYNGTMQIWETKGLAKDEADYIGNQYGRGLSSPDNSKYSSPHKVTFLRTGSLRRLTKERVRFLIPSVQAELKGRGNTKVTITCLADPPIDKTKGSQYFGAYISASLHKRGKNGELVTANPRISDNRNKWDACYHFSNIFSGFSAGDWEVWLDLSTRWFDDDNQEIPYALVVTVEDMTKTNDIYAEIIAEAAGRFQPITSVRIPVR